MLGICNQTKVKLDWTKDNKVRVLSPVLSNGNLLKGTEEKPKEKLKIKCSLTTKISLALMVPILILIGMTISSLNDSIQTQEKANNVQTAIGK